MLLSESFSSLESIIIGFIVVLFLFFFPGSLFFEGFQLFRTKKERPLTAKDWIFGALRCLPSLLWFPLLILSLYLVNIKVWLIFLLPAVYLPLFFWFFRPWCDWKTYGTTLLLSASASASCFNGLGAIASSPSNNPIAHPVFNGLFICTSALFIALLFLYACIRFSEKHRSFTSFAWDVSVAASTFLPFGVLYAILLRWGEQIYHLYLT
ncbi:MAG: hypothetical protein II348_02135 [Clostridia bacterium]|nr:hypothetical protein [Clostridia bacterium]